MTVFSIRAQSPVQLSLILYGLQGQLRQPAQSTCLNLRLVMLNASHSFPGTTNLKN